MRSTSCAASRWQVALKQVGRNARHSTSTSATAVGRRKPFVFVCPNITYGCDYTSYRLSSIMYQHPHRRPKQLVAVAHAVGTISDSEAFESNQESKPAQQCFVYDQDGCDNSYPSKSNLTKHIKDTHDWVQKKCDKAGCTDETEFETGESIAHTSGSGTMIRMRQPHAASLLVMKERSHLLPLPGRASGPVHQCNAATRLKQGRQAS